MLQEQGEAEGKTGQGVCARFSHHIVQRGHNRQTVFVERRDFEYYLTNLQEWAQVYKLEVFSYCLMTNQVHSVVQANDNVTAIPQLLKRLVGRLTSFVNLLEKRRGSLWEGRYKISRIDTDAYLFSYCRYVEFNPVKAGMVDRSESYEWSSYSELVGCHPAIAWMSQTLFGLWQATMKCGLRPIGSLLSRKMIHSQMS